MKSFGLCKNAKITIIGFFPLKGKVHHHNQNDHFPPDGIGECLCSSWGIPEPTEADSSVTYMENLSLLCLKAIYLCLHVGIRS